MILLGLLRGVYQVLSLGTLLWIARIFQPRVTVVDRSMRLMQWGLWLVTGFAFAAAFWTRFQEKLVWGGGILFLLGLVLRIWAIFTLGSRFSYSLRIPDRRITAGPYKYFRHPAYVGSVACYTGVGLVWGSWSAAIVFLVGIGVLFAWRAYVESKLLDRLPVTAH